MTKPWKYRFQAVWSVLRGKPTIFGVRDKEMIHIDCDLNRGGLVTCCEVSPDLEP